MVSMLPCAIAVADVVSARQRVIRDRSPDGHRRGRSDDARIAHARPHGDAASVMLRSLQNTMSRALPDRDCDHVRAIARMRRLRARRRRSASPVESPATCAHRRASARDGARHGSAIHAGPQGMRASARKLPPIIDRMQP
jgi:hypothetical protein